mgnify:CR=1 FL=1
MDKVIGATPLVERRAMQYHMVGKGFSVLTLTRPGRLLDSGGSIMGWPGQGCQIQTFFESTPEYWVSLITSWRAEFKSNEFL